MDEFQRSFNSFWHSGLHQILMKNLKELIYDLEGVIYLIELEGSLHKRGKGRYLLGAKTRQICDDDSPLTILIPNKG